MVSTNRPSFVCLAGRALMPSLVRLRTGALASMALLVSMTPLRGADANGPLSFNRDIRPILSDNCFACHGFDSKHRKAGLRLDVSEDALKPNKEGRIAIRPGDPSQSEVWKRIITEDPDDKMPPPDSHKKLTPAQVATIKRWIEQGAPFQRHWSFEPPVQSAVPKSSILGAVQYNGIDGFIQARLSREGLKPMPEADRETLIRRVSFDLRGLPPTPVEVDLFLADKAAGAYERMVDRFMDSPAFGEQMGRHWLDVARYADTHGLHLDNERHMWAYRDWVIQAFNRNLPFDQFTIEQLAGDQLPSPTQDQLIATGFSRCNVTTGEGGAIDAEFIYRYAVERASTMAQTWLGLTAGCAVCHDHKFDPISTKEFYSMYAFFHSAADPAMDGNALRTPPTLQLKTPEDEVKLKEFDEQIRAAEHLLKEKASTIAYIDPASLTPPPAPRDLDTVWADDEIPAGAKITASPGAPTQFVTADKGPVFSGKRSLKRQDKGLAQDVVDFGSAIEVPQDGKLYAHVYLDPSDPPKTVMLQYRTGDWKHRATWGDYEAIDWGAKGTTERVNLGGLPKVGEWVRLEMDAAKVGLKPGDKVTGFATTQYGGTVYWDKLGITGRIDPVKDPTRSLAAWLAKHEGKESKELPEDVRKIFKEVPLEKRTPDQTRRLREHFLVRECAELRSTFEPLQMAVSDARKRRSDYNDAIPTTFTFRDMDQPRESFVMLRGAYDKPGEKVTRNVPAIFPPLKNTTNPNRLDLARWLVSDEHPLTARVAVNRYWQQFFGTGLVKTSEDFGSQGSPPSHPELLDWLAVVFRDSGWDTKALVRLLVTSATYRQSSAVTPDLIRKDPENQLLARGPRFRLDAEQLRDNALFVSGLMSSKMGGRGVKPYQPENIWEPVGYSDSNTRYYKQDKGESLYRRSLYTFLKRTAPAPFMATFDAPNRELFCARRERGNTPLQALQLMNDVQHFEAARALAERALSSGGTTARDQISWLFRTVLSRAARPNELDVVTKALETHRAKYRAQPDAAKAAIRNGESQPNPTIPEPELAAWTLVANLILNLDETVTRN